MESTGSELLDAAALRMVERAEPFPEPPAEVTDLTFTVPVVFVKQLPSNDWVEQQGKVNAKIHGICRGC